MHAFYSPISLIEAAIKENDPDFLTVALGDVAKAEGMTKVARKAKVARENLYRAFSPSGNPTMATVMRVLNALGLRICVSPAVAQVRLRQREPPEEALPPALRHDHERLAEAPVTCYSSPPSGPAASSEFTTSPPSAEVSPLSGMSTGSPRSDSSSFSSPGTDVGMP